MPVNISMLGDVELQRKLLQLDVRMQKFIAKKALKEATGPMLAMAKALCPVGDGREVTSKKTNETTKVHLRDTLHVKALKGKGKVVGWRVSTGSREALGIDPDDKYYYPVVLEVGHGNVAARPYLRPTIDNQREKLLRIVLEALRRDVEEAAKS